MQGASYLQTKISLADNDKLGILKTGKNSNHLISKESYGSFKSYR